MSSDSKRDAARRVLDVYEAAPFPPDAAPGGDHAGTTLPPNWVNGAVHPAGPALHAGARILMAGCGTGAGALGMARALPGATVVGLDFSERAIAVGRRALHAAPQPNLRLEVADLTAPGLASRHGQFDFVSCHAVVDYVPDTPALMRELAGCLAEHGVLYLGLNSEHHPSERVRRVFARLGRDASHFDDTPEQRAALRVTAALMGSDARIEGLGELRGHVVSADLFPTFAHHRPLAWWVEAAGHVGLHLAGTLDALTALGAVSDADLPLLYSLNRPGLSSLVADARTAAGQYALLTRSPAPSPPWHDLAQLRGWVLTADPCLGLAQLAPITGDWPTPRSLVVQFPGLPAVELSPTSFALEVLRRCDGTVNLGEVLGAIPHRGEDERLVATLFRAWHACILHAAPA